MYVSVNQVHFGVQMNETFVDTKRIPIHKKRVRPLDQQGEFESRRLVHFSHLQYLKFVASIFSCSCGIESMSKGS